MSTKRKKKPAAKPRAARDEADALLEAELASPVFGLPFFASMLSTRFRGHCPGTAPEVPQVLLHLGGGAALDVCHIAELAPRWLAAAVFRDDRSCDRMDLEFVPYALILRVTVSSRTADERPIGFDVQRSQAAIPAGALREGGRHDAYS